MGLYFKVMAVLVALLWVPLSSHCTWEHLPGLEFLGCCTNSDATPLQENNCETDGCAVVESGSYKIEEQPVSIPAPLLVACIVAASLADETPSLKTSAAPASPPPELSRIWQFAFRTAAPSRAPSSVS